jgi:hypothetical protein
MERVERRRTLVEINLLSEGGARTSIAQRGRGCLSFLSHSVLIVAALVAHAMGLV